MVYKLKAHMNWLLILHQLTFPRLNQRFAIRQKSFLIFCNLLNIFIHIFPNFSPLFLLHPHKMFCSNLLIAFGFFWLLTIHSVVIGVKYRINGTLKCRYHDGMEKPYHKEAIIQLWEADANLFGFIDKDDLLGETKSSKNGFFELNETKDEWEMGELEPYLLIRHICWGQIPPEENCALLSRMDLQPTPAAKMIPPIILGTDIQLKTMIMC